MQDYVPAISMHEQLTCFLMRNLLAPTMTSSYPEDGIKQLKSAKQPLNDCMMSSMLTGAKVQLICS